MRSELIALLLLFSSADAYGKGILHRVRLDNETYGDIADHYYGQRYLERHLRLFNRRPEPLKKGTTIIIPTYAVVAVRRGQSLREFAAAHLNDPGRAGYLAELHRLRGREQQHPRPGKRLRVVQSLKHVARRGETLESIANLYYRDAGPRRIKLLTLYNKLDAPAVRPGQSIRIPLDTSAFSRSVVARRAEKTFSLKKEVALEPPPAPPPPRGRRRPPPKAKSEAKQASKRLAAELERVERLYGNGNYRDAKKNALRALTAAPDGATHKTKVELLRLLAYAQIALGDFSDAKATFKEILTLEPKYELDLYTTSPKILDIFEAVAMR